METWGPPDPFTWGFPLKSRGIWVPTFLCVLFCVGFWLCFLPRECHIYKATQSLHWVTFFTVKWILTYLAVYCILQINCLSLQLYFKRMFSYKTPVPPLAVPYTEQLWLIRCLINILGSLLAHHVLGHRPKSALAQTYCTKVSQTKSIVLQDGMTPRLPFLLAEWAECSWHLHNTRLQRPFLAPLRPVCSASYFLMTKCLCETIEVDFSPNPGYSVGSLCGSGNQQFRRLTKHDCFTSAPLAACNAIHTGKERWAREWGGVDSYSDAFWAGLGGEEGRAMPATITHHSTTLNLENAPWTQVVI